MTRRENFLRMMRGEGAERLPLDLPVTPPIAERIQRGLGKKDWADDFQLGFRGLHPAYPDRTGEWEAAYKRLGVILPEPHHIDPFGITHYCPPRETLGEAWHLRELFHSLAEIETAEQLESLPWPDVEAAAPYAHFAERVKEIHDAGFASAGGMECTIFEASWYLRGMDNLFLDLMEGNPAGTWLLDWFTERSLKGVQAYCEAGVDVIRLGDDVGTQKAMMMSVEMWREHLKPRLKKIVDAVRAAERDKVWILYHSDGAIEPIIPDLIEVGIDILNPVQPECMDAPGVVRRYKDKLAFWGLIGTQSTLPHGAPEDVRAAVAECAQWARDGARIVLAPTHVIEPDVPYENILALVEAVKQISPME